MQAQAEALHVWLGIPPAEQPPNHYRLLGVPLFSQDTAAIRKAYAARLDLIRQKAFEQPEAANILQTNVRHAAECLIDAASRAAYDEQLRAAMGLAPAHAPPAGPQGMAVSGATPAVAVRTDVPPHDSTERTPGWLWPLIGGALVAGLGCVAVGAWWLTRTPAESPLAHHAAPEPASSADESRKPATPAVEEDPFKPASPAPSPSPEPRPAPGSVPAASPPAKKPRVVEEDPFKVISPLPVTPPVSLPVRPEPRPDPSVVDAPSTPPTPPAPGTSSIAVGPPAFPTPPQPDPMAKVAPVPPVADAPGSAVAATRELVVAPSFSALPKSAAIPSAIVQGERTVLAWAQPLTGQPELELLSDSTQLPEGQAFQLQPIAGKDPPQWRVNVTGAGPAPLPLAQFTLDDKELRMQWARDIRGLPFHQLANSLVRLRAGGETRTVALREPVKKEPYTLSLAKKVDTLTFDVGELPRLNTLHLLMVGDPAQLPVPGKFRRGASFATLGQPVVMEFDEVEGATLEFRLVRKGDDLAVQVSGRVKDTSGDEIELTTERIANLRSGTESALNEAQRDLVLRAQELEANQFRYGQAQAMQANNLTEVQQKRVALETLQGNIKVANTRIASLRKRIPLLQKRLTELPKLERLVKKLHDTAQMPFKIVSALDSDEIVLVDGS